MQKQTKLVVLGIFILCVVFGTTPVAAAVGRVAEFREVFKANPMPVFPQYVAGVTEAQLYDIPSPNELFSYAKDNEVWTGRLLTQLREASVEADALIEKWIGDPVLVVVIDFETRTAYTATISTETGIVLAEYQDTETEVWASLAFARELIAYAETHPEATEQELVDFAISRYYHDWGAWVDMGWADLMLTPDMLYSMLVVGLAGTTGILMARRRK